MNKIVGNPLVTPMKVADWNQTDPKKSDYIKNKPDIAAIESNVKFKISTWKKIGIYLSGDCVLAVLSSGKAALLKIIAPILVNATKDFPDTESDFSSKFEVLYTFDKDECDLTYNPKSENAQSGKAVAEAIAQIVNGSPEALDTLYELAEALGNDKNFSTTVMNEIGKKADHSWVEETFERIIVSGDLIVEKAFRDGSGNIFAQHYAKKSEIPTVDVELNAFSDNPIANSAITRYVETQLPSKPDVDAFADGNRVAKKAQCDSDGNQIITTYATKEEVGNIENALDAIIDIQNALLGVNE